MAPRILPGSLPEWRIRLNSSMAMRVGLLFCVVACITLLYPKGLVETFKHPEGTVWDEEDLIARFPFPIYRNSTMIEEEQKAAAHDTPMSFDRDEQFAHRSATDTLRLVTQRLIVMIDPMLAGAAARESDPFIGQTADELTQADEHARAPMRIPREAWIWLVNLRAREFAGNPQRDSLRTFIKIAEDIIDAVYQKGLLDKEKRLIHQSRLAVRIGQLEELVPTDGLLDTPGLPSFIRKWTAAYGLHEPVQELCALLLPPLCHPSVFYNPERTQTAIRAAVERVPRSLGVVKENERIVARHERITPAVKAKLDSYARASREREGDSNATLAMLGSAGHTIVILSFLLIYLYLFRKQIFFSNTRLLLLMLILGIEAVMAYVSTIVSIGGPVQFLIIVPAAAMMYTIIFDTRVAFYGTVTTSFLIGALRGNDYTIVLASILAGILAVYTVRDIKNRTQIFRSLAFILLGYAFVITADGLQRALPLSTMGMEYLFAFVNALLSPVVTFGLLIFFERGFGISTDLTLLELSDFNHPLLRELSSRAPGTFHHSINMGSLAEAAAAAIGANAILARVGAYYHDIGKISDPEYFVENQAGASNVHESLEPEESARRIIGHVAEGIRLAEEYRLPRRVIDFIPAHHGTTLVHFFYEKQRISMGDAAEAEPFRYRGPSPDTKETAIVMLADTIEASARTLEDPTVEKIETLIDTVVSQRMQQGQFAQCDLTFRDLSTIKKSFLGILTGIHHSRIKYPSESDAELARKAAERTRKLLSMPSTAEAIMQRMKRIEPE
jgi:cyclic-di-AMP phosphodiesterase PgpH